jgi:tyrosyl-tRNA synthetase
MFGKIMKLPDHLMESYYTLLTDLPPEQFKPLIASNPRDAKVALARHIISWLHDDAAGMAAEKAFMTATHGGIPEEMPEIVLDSPGPHQLAPLLVKAGMVSSNGEAIRKMKEGAVRINGEKVVDHQKQYTFTEAVVLQMGNRRFVRLISIK